MENYPSVNRADIWEGWFITAKVIILRETYIQKLYTVESGVKKMLRGFSKADR